MPTSMGPQKRLEHTKWKPLQPSSHKCMSNMHPKLSSLFSAYCSCSSATSCKLSTTLGPSSPIICLPQWNCIVQVVHDTCRGEQDQPLHALLILQCIDSTEVCTKQVLDGCHLLQPCALTPPLNQPDEEGLGFAHAAQNVIVLHPDLKTVHAWSDPC